MGFFACGGERGGGGTLPSEGFKCGGLRAMLYFNFDSLWKAVFLEFFTHIWQRRPALRVRLGDKRGAFKHSVSAAIEPVTKFKRRCDDVLNGRETSADFALRSCALNICYSLSLCI